MSLPLPPSPSGPRAADPLLRPFLNAPADSAALHAALGKLLVEVADPVIRRVVGGRFRVSLGKRASAARDRDTLDAEDTCAEAHATLTRRLHALRGAGPTGAPPATTITDFGGYVAAVAYSTWADYLRRRRPERARLLNQMRYLLEDNGNQRGFGLWDGAEGERLAGFAAWRERAEPPAPAERLRALLADPAGFVGDAVPLGELRKVNPARLLAVLFDRLGGPVRIEDLLEAVAALWDIQAGDAAAAGDSTPGDPEETMCPLPGPHDAVRWGEYLHWLWEAVGGLPVRQRAAFLLHSDVVREFELAGVASIRAVAAALEVSPEDFARFWNDLPLPDQAIAERLGATRQQVINLRKAARLVLGRQLAVFLADPPAFSPATRRFLPQP